MNIRIGMIGGTGLGAVLQQSMEPSEMRVYTPADVNTPFGEPSSSVVTGVYNDIEIAILQRHGEGHTFNPSAVPYRANIFALKSLGCTHILASGATGSLNESIAPGDVVICDQLIDRTVVRMRTFFERAAVHIEFADPMCPVMREWLMAAGRSLKRDTDQAIHERGTYVCIEGPSFSTRAEARMHQAWGADVVGMTALPEARLAREAEMAYALIALPTDFDCIERQPISNEPVPDTKRRLSLIEEIKGNLDRATSASIDLIKAALADVNALKNNPSPAHTALALGIWSDKSRISPKEVTRLEVLWGRYFS